MKRGRFMDEVIKEVKEIVERECEGLRVTYAAKTGWLLLKTKDKNKGIGAIRINKKSFITLYVDTKKNYFLKDCTKITDPNTIDIQSRLSGNFVQNKIRVIDENFIYLITEILNDLIENDKLQLDTRIRN
jgi:hypothetical protein